MAITPPSWVKSPRCCARCDGTVSYALQVLHDPAQGDSQRSVEPDVCLLIATTRPTGHDRHGYALDSRPSYESIATHHLQRGTQHQQSQGSLNMREALVHKGLRHRLAEEDNIRFDQVRLTDQ